MKLPFFRQAAGPALPWAHLRRRLPSPVLALVALALLLLALLLGAIVALGSLSLTIGFTALLLAVPVLFMFSTRALLPLLFLMTFLVQGVMVEFLHIRLGAWLTSALAGLLLLRALLELTPVNRVKLVAPHAGSGMATAVYIASLAYLAFFFFSLSQGHASTLQRFSSLRFAIPMFGVLFALYWFRWPPAQLRRLWWIFLAIVVLQVFPVIYQHFGPAKRLGWDAVTGTFGPNMSAAMVLATVAAMSYALARWNHGVSSRLLPLCMVPTGLLILLMGEVKAIVLWLPLALLIVLRRRVLRNIGTLFVYGIFALVFMAGTFAAYKAMYWGEKGAAGNTLEEKLQKTGGYFFDVHEIHYRTGEISRGAALYLWYTDPVPSTMERLIGYGPGASLSSSGTGKGVVAARYRSLSINPIALAQLLWDVGILGALAFLTMLGIGLAAGFRLLRSGRGTAEERAMTDTATAMLVLYASTVVYNRALLDEPTVQLLFFFCLGCIVQVWRFGQTADAVRHDGLKGGTDRLVRHAL
ncbi:hypothetical protein [Massilia sp. NR 4-1]|uniref:hypothetical protein n=1 Tax=Massilia sp. NR 4-1 TaxID=1678028 RepID=UPI00067AAEB4|nr:hypothetical protein [Massilia sp. NR 4-1]AKU22034.1 hypothetical protein ACZ75_11725 [Massilia sp. NR 4-1]